MEVSYGRIRPAGHDEGVLMSQEQRDAVDQILRDAPLDLGGNVEEQRPILEQILTAHPLPQDVLISDGVVGGVPVVDICIEGRNADDVLLFFHGGAYALGSAAMAAGLGAELARRADARVVSVDYRLAPQEPYPAAVEGGLTAYRGLVDGGVPVGRLAVAGESAGAGLALATLLAAKAEGLPQPSAAVLFSPWVDLTLSGESMTAMAQVDPAITGAGLRRRAADYVASADPTDPLVS